LIWWKIILVRVNSSFFHSVHCTCTVWKNEKFSLTKKIFRQNNFLVISLVRLLLSRNICEKMRETKSQQFPHCALHRVEKREILCHANFFPSNQVIAKFFSKTLIWRNFWEKTVAVKFCNFHSVLFYHTVQ